MGFHVSGNPTAPCHPHSAPGKPPSFRDVWEGCLGSRVSPCLPSIRSPFLLPTEPRFYSSLHPLFTQPRVSREANPWTGWEWVRVSVWGQEPSRRWLWLRGWSVCIPCHPAAVPGAPRPPPHVDPFLRARSSPLLPPPRPPPLLTLPPPHFSFFKHLSRPPAWVPGAL